MRDARKILIAGAGPAGLTAGFELASRHGFDVHIFEASDIIGGISATVRHGGNRMDLGGHRFFSKSARVNDWWLARMPLTDDPDADDRCMMTRPRVSRIYYMRRFFDYPVRMSAQTLLNMGPIRTLRAGAGFIGARIHRRPEDNLENFYINRFGKPLYEMFFEDYTEKVWGVHPSKLGADWGSQRVKGLSLAGLVKDMLSKTFSSKRDASKVETSLIEQFIYPKYGPGQMWETVADDFRKLGGKLDMQSQVTAVNVDPASRRINSVEVLGADGSSRTIGCDSFISSMPLRELVGALRGIDIPDDIARIAAGLPYRDFITVGLLVPELALRNKTAIKTHNDRIPDTWIYVQERSVRLGRIQIFNNWSRYMVADPDHTMWIGLEYFCNEGDAMWRMTDGDFIGMAVRELRQIGVITDATPVLDSIRLRVRKAYPAYFGTYRELDKLRRFLDSIPNLYCVGRNGQHRYNNMDHSMLTAMEAADAIASGNPSRDAIWSVNTEEDYHETSR